MSISRQRIEDIAKVYDIPVSSARLSRQVTYRIHDQAIRVRYDVAGHVWAAWHDRADGSTRAVWGGVASVVSLMVELAERGWTEPTTSPAEEIIQAEEIAQAAAYAEAPASAPGRGVDAFDEIERSDAAAAEFERMPRRETVQGDVMVVRNHGNWGHGLRPGMSSDLNCSACRREDAELSSQVRQQAAAERARQERRPVYDSQELITVTKLGPDTFELGRWDQEEEDYVHAITLSRQEAADLIYVLARAFAALPE